MKFLYSLAFILGSLHSCLAATKLNGFGAVTYEGDHGFPEDVPIAFETDFDAVTSNPAVGQVSFSYSVSGDGATYIDGGALVVNDNTQFTITFGRTAAIPAIGIYTVSIAVDMIYKNSAGDTLMHEKTYQITINLSGTTATQTLQVQGAGTEYTETTDTGAANADSIASLPPGDLALSQTNGGAVAFGTDITLRAATTDNTYDLWWDNTLPIEVFSDNGYSTKVYEWPVALVTGLAIEGGSSEILDMTLKSVPVALYNLQQIYISLTVKFRDTAGDRRALRSLEESGRALQRKEEASTQLNTEVKFDNAEDSGAASTALSMLALGAGAVAALLL